MKSVAAQAVSQGGNHGGFLGATLRAAAAAALGAWIIGLVCFGDTIPRTVTDGATHTDAIVVLTGGSERLRTGVRLLAENKADRLFVSGVHPAVDRKRLLQVSGEQVSGEAAHRVAGRIDAGHDAVDTLGNAEETRSWMREKGFHTLRLVTSSYHMPRSLMEFERALPDAVVIPHPVFSTQLNHGAWWQSPATALLVISEFNKYLLSLLSVGLSNALLPSV